jgi:hypothetical protein
VNGLPRNRLYAGVALVLLLCMGFALLFHEGGEARGSSLSKGPNGWLAARRYLEARGARVTLLDAPFEASEERQVLVTAFPWQQGAAVEAAEALENHLRRGGDLVLGYSGLEGNPGETVVMERLGLPLTVVREVTLNPVRWRAAAREEWRLRPDAAAARGASPVRVWATRLAPEMPPKAEALFRSPDGKPAIALLRRYKGRIFLLPSDALSNARLGEPGNSGLLETLRVRLGDRWTFDEYHHGLIGVRGVETAAFGRALDLILLHLAALYLFALWTLSRRFGPAWSEPPAVTGSAGTFLLGLGALHHRLGHHAQAALRLLERVRELDRDLDLPADLDRRAAVAGPRELVALAREIARRRTLRHPENPPADIERETAA